MKGRTIDLTFISKKRVKQNGGTSFPVVETVHTFFFRRGLGDFS